MTRHSPARGGRFRAWLSALAPGAGTFLVARRRLRVFRPRHFQPFRGWLAPHPRALEDRAHTETESINAASRRYFERTQGREYWLNRPFSERPPDPSGLWRFGLLVAALRLRPGSRVLDFGCGTGWTSTLLARMGLDVTGMDVAPAALELAREAAGRDLVHTKDARLRFEAYRGGAIDAPDGQFDAVLVFDAFHHFPNPRQLLGEFHRVLGPHGGFAFGEPGVGHAQTAESEAERALGVLEQDVDIEQLYQTARGAGFGELDVVVPPLPPQVLTLPMPRLRAYLRGLSWLVPADLVRGEILTGPMGVFRKGPWRITSLAPGAQGARISLASASTRVQVGAPFRIQAELVNTAETVWLREGRNGRGYVRLGAHLLDEEERTLEADYGRAELPGDVPEGGRARVELELRAPAASGRFLVRLDLVNEGFCWFETVGSPAADHRLEVEP